MTLRNTRLVALSIALLSLAPAARAADWEIFLLGDHSRHFSKQATAADFMAAFDKVTEEDGATWENTLTVDLGMPESFTHGRVVFEEVATIHFGSVPVKLYRDQVRGQKDLTRIHAFAIDEDGLEDDALEWLQGVSWARKHAEGSVHDFSAGGRELVIALAGRIRSEFNQEVTQGVIRKYVSTWGDAMHATVQNHPEHEDWDFFVAAWRALGWVSLEIEWDTVYDATKIKELHENVVDALVTVAIKEGKALQEKRQARLEAEADGGRRRGLAGRGILGQGD